MTTSIPIRGITALLGLGPLVGLGSVMGLGLGTRMGSVVGMDRSLVGMVASL